MRKRSIKLSLRLSESEYNRLKEQVLLSGFSQEQYLRNLIASENMRPRPLGEMIEIRRQLNAIGNNINQLARKANSSGWISRDEVLKALSFQEQLWELIKRL